MYRAMLTLLAVSATMMFVNTQDKKAPLPKPSVDLFGSIEDEQLAMEKPALGVIVSEKGWAKLVKAWGLKDAPKVDFTKELLVVETTRGSRMNLTARVDDNGDLQVLAISTRDLRPGFRYAIKSVPREGIKTVSGKELPKE